MTLICAHLFSFLLSPIFPICYSLKEINTINLLFATVPFFLNVNRCSFFFFGGVFFPPLIRCPHSVCSWTFHQPKHTERTLGVAKLSYLVLYNSIQYSTQFSQPHCNCSIDLFQHQNDQHVQDDACGGDGHPHAGLGFRIGVHGPHA